jgi:hypothetical protein
MMLPSSSSIASGGLWKPLGRLRLVLILVVVLLFAQFLMLPSHDRTIIVTSNHATITSTSSSTRVGLITPSSISRRQQAVSSQYDSSNGGSDGPPPKVSLPPGNHDDITPRVRSKRHDDTRPLATSSPDGLLTLSAGGWIKMDAAPVKDTEHCIVSQGMNYLMVMTREGGRKEEGGRRKGSMDMI